MCFTCYAFAIRISTSPFYSLRSLQLVDYQLMLQRKFYLWCVDVFAQKWHCTSSENWSFIGAFTCVYKNMFHIDWVIYIYMYINNDVYVAKVKRNIPGKTYDKMLSEAKNLFITVIYINAYAIYDMHIKS